MTNSFLNDKKLVIKDMAILRELLNNIMYTDISKDYNKFKALSNEIFRIIKRNSFNDELLEEVKVELRGEIKSYEDFLERLRNKNKVLENKESYLPVENNDINEIIDVVIKQLEYKDADEDIIDTLKYISL